SSASAQGYQVDDLGNLFGDFGANGLWRWGGSWTQLSSADPTRIAVASNGRLFAGFSGGLWTWSSATGWAFLSSAVASELDSADGTLFACFASGTWRWAAGGGWTFLSSARAEQGAAADGGSFFADFGASGLWRWTTAGWTQLSSAN